MGDEKNNRIRYGVTERGLTIWYVSKLANAAPRARLANRGMRKTAGRKKTKTVAASKATPKASNED